MKNNKIIKNNGLIGRVKFLLALLVLSGGLLAGVKMVQTGQDGRSSAATNTTLYYFSPIDQKCYKTTAYSDIVKCNRDKSKYGLCFMDYNDCIQADDGCQSYKGGLYGGRCQLISQKCPGVNGFVTDYCQGSNDVLCCLACSPKSCSSCLTYDSCNAQKGKCKWGYNGLSTLNCSKR